MNEVPANASWTLADRLCWDVEKILKSWGPCLHEESAVAAKFASLPVAKNGSVHAPCMKEVKSSRSKVAFKNQQGTSVIDQSCGKG